MIEVIQQYGEALIGLFGVVVGGLIVSLREAFQQRYESRREGSYSAIRLICILEEFAHKCIDVADDDGYNCGQPAGRTESGEEFCAAQVATPDPLEFPDDIAWRSIKEPLMHRILALPNKVRNTDRYVSASAENAFPPEFEEFFEPRQEGYARLGLEALSIIEDLRKQFDVLARSETDLNSGWDPKAHLQHQITRFDKRDAERNKRLAAIKSPFPLPSSDNERSAAK